MERPVKPARCVVLLHAFPCDGRMWAAQADALSEAGWDLIIPDLPGFGASDVLEAEPSLDLVADVVLRELSVQRIEGAVLAGLSLGGYVAMAMMRKSPERFSALMLCDTKASADTAEARESRHRLAESVVEEPAECGRILRGSLLPVLLGATTFAERLAVVEEVGGWLDEARPQAVAWYQRAMAARPTSIPTLAAASIPALVLWGEEDTLSPEADQRAMLQALTNATSACIPGAGHLSAVERPEAVSRRMIEFLEGSFVRD